jgi:hypothetical protein
MTPRIRQRTAQQLDSMVGSAGKVLGQAADLGLGVGLGGYRMLGGLLARPQPNIQGSSQPKTIEDVQSVLAGGASKAASFKNSILRRGTVSSATPSAVSRTKSPDRETELSDVVKHAEDTSTATEKGNEAGSTVSIGSRLASLPGLAKLNAGSASMSPAASERVQPATVTGATQPTRVRLSLEKVMHMAE